MLIRTIITWPDGTITSRDVNFNNRDQRQKFEHLQSVALFKGGRVFAAKAEKQDQKDQKDQQPKDYVELN